MSALPKLTPGAGASNFIDDCQIHGLLARKEPDGAELQAVLDRSLAKQPLTLQETATLLAATSPESQERIFEAARALKREVYGSRIVLFAPLYLGNECVNDCRYCAFRRSNPNAVRRTLSTGELRAQVEALVGVGHKRLILVCGEHPSYDAGYLAEAVRTIYDVKVGHGEIRRVNINAAPLDEAGYRRLAEAGIGTYQIFQETYHASTYRRVHPHKTRKADFAYRLDGLDRAMRAGCDDVGIGVLFGLYDWRFEVLGLVAHASHLMDRFGVGCHTVSFPRLRPAQGVVIDEQHRVDDEDLKRLVAVLRLAVPYAGLILTAREEPALRREVIDLGVSQIDAGSRIELGGYTDAAARQALEREQFSLGDTRSLDEARAHR